MAHIYIYSPSSAVRNKAAFRRGVKRLQAQGHAVELDPDVLSTHMRFAGDDDTRVAAVHRAAASGADVALTARGGYGLTRILPRLDYTLLDKAVARGTTFTGFSDFTALQMALLARGATPTWAGPSVCDDFGAEVEPDGTQDEVMQACFDDFLAGRGEGAGWRLTGRDLAGAGAMPLPASLELNKATLWGGNLCVLSALVGTPFFPAVKGGLLFLEDVAEHPYRIERMLTQLLLAGVLQRQKAILLGQFTAFQAFPHDKGFGLNTVIHWLRSQTDVPVLTGLPMGHVPTKVMLPVGRKVSLTVEGRDAFVLWAHGH